MICKNSIVILLIICMSIFHNRTEMFFYFCHRILIEVQKPVKRSET